MDKILIIQTAFLGDVVLTTPLFRALRRLRPSACIGLLTTPAAKPLVEENPDLNEILVYDKKGGEKFLDALGKVRRFGADVIVSPHRSHRSSLLALLSGARLRVGFDEAGFSFAYNKLVHRDATIHEVDRNLALLAGLGEVPIADDRKLHCGYSGAEAQAALDILPEGAKYVGLCAGSVWATKRWLPEGFAQVGNRLAKAGYTPVLLGGPDDVTVAREVAARLDAKFVDTVGKTSLKTLPALIDRLELLITNDSSPLHVAGARGKPVVAIFGPTVLEFGFGPFNTNSAVVEVSLDCRPCGPHGAKSCPNGQFKCMKEIDAEQVLDKALRLLENTNA